MMKRIVCAVLLFSLVGCGRIEALFLDPHEKVRQAFPLSGAADRALQALQTRSVTEKQALPAGQMGVEELIRTRSMRCAASISIAAWDRGDDLKARLNDRACFDREDARLAQIIQMRTVAGLLRANDLVPHGPIRDGSEIAVKMGIGTFDIAESANVAIAGASDGTVDVVDINDGRRIHTLNIGAGLGARGLISPNGRVLAVPLQPRLLRVLSTETGESSWESPDHSTVLGWLPDTDAAITLSGDANAAQLLDLMSGEVTPLLPSEPGLQWAWRMPSPQPQYLVAGRQSLVLMVFSRNEKGGLQANTVQRWSMDRTRAHGERPALMLEGKRFVYRDAAAIRWIGLGDGNQGAWELDSTSLQSMQKLNDRQLLLRARVDRNGIKTFVLDVSDGQVSELNEADARQTFLPVGVRSVAAQRVHQALVFRHEVAGDNPRPIDELIAQANLTRQLVALERATAAPKPLDSYEARRSSEAITRYESMLRTLPPGVDAQTRATLEAQLARERASMAMQQRDAIASGQGSLRAPMIPNIPGNARVVALGVYEGTPAGGVKPGALSAGGQRNASRPPGMVRVNVLPDSAPLVLVLSSYEPVNWLLSNPNGRRIAAILVSGYHQGKVYGSDQATPVMIGREHAYELGSPGYIKLQQSVSSYVGRPIQLFQGRYKGSDFSVR